MRSAVSFQAIPVLIDGHDTEGSLVLHDGQLVAVLARLDGDSHDAEFKGRWHLEAGFGPCQEVGTRLFESLEDAARWAYSRVQPGRRAEMAEARGTVSQSEPLTHAGTRGRRRALVSFERACGDGAHQDIARDWQERSCIVGVAGREGASK